MSGVHKEQLEQSVRGRVAGDKVGERSERQVRLEPPPHTHTPRKVQSRAGTASEVRWKQGAQQGGDCGVRWKRMVAGPGWRPRTCSDCRYTCKCACSQEVWS